MSVIWEDEAWNDYVILQKKDKPLARKINERIRDIQRNGNQGTGNPEPLKYEWSGYWSRRIDKENRLIYRLENDNVRIAQCRSHYDDK